MLRRNFRLVRGTDLNFANEIARDNAGAVIDLTGATIAWRIGPRGRYSTNITKTETDGITVNDGPTGDYSGSLPGADTVSLFPGRYRHAIEVTETGGEIHLVQEGIIHVERDLP